MMKGYAMMGIGKTQWIEKEKPTCGYRDAIIRPLAVAICISDVHTVWGGAIGDRKNLILGHEAVGEVVEVGSLVRDFKIGDKVLIPSVTPNWSSIEAQMGYPSNSNGMNAGWEFSNIKDGVYADFFHINDADGNLAMLPKNMTYAEGCMLSDMIPTAFLGAEIADIQYGDCVVIIGIGCVGLLAIAASKLRGAGRIIVVGCHKKYIDVAKMYGATDFIDDIDGDITNEVFDLTNKKCVDKVIICGGKSKIFKDAINIVRAGGIISNVNYIDDGEFIEIPRLAYGVGMGHKAIYGTLMPGGRYKTEKYANLLSFNRIDVNPIFSSIEYGWDNLEKGLLSIKEKPSENIKPVIIL